MSKYLSEKYRSLTAYTPGEQPQDQKYVKLNTNESPFPPSAYAQRLARRASGDLQLYSDPECKALVSFAAEKFGISNDQIIFTNGSDEVLNFAFMAFCDKSRPVVFPQITYGFYKVFAQLNNLPYEEIALNNDFTINVNDYIGIDKNIFIANPNAPTGIALSLEEIEKIVSSNPGRIVVIDEAYVDFGAESAVKLVDKYENLLVTQTFSKSRSLAGARLGFGIASKEIIDDLKLIKYSTNPYNINMMTMYAGIGALADAEYFDKNCKTIEENRQFTTDRLDELGFIVLPSKANFIFAKKDGLDGEKIYLDLKARGVLVRHFDSDIINDYIRITIGSREQMEILIKTLEEIL